MTNMMNRQNVADLMEAYGYDTAAAWVRDNRKHYVEALQAMGRAVSQNGSGE